MEGWLREGLKEYRIYSPNEYSKMNCDNGWKNIRVHVLHPYKLSLKRRVRAIHARPSLMCIQHRCRSTSQRHRGKMFTFALGTLCIYTVVEMTRCLSACIQLSVYVFLGLWTRPADIYRLVLLQRYTELRRQYRPFTNSPICYFLYTQRLLCGPWQALWTNNTYTSRIQRQVLFGYAVL